MSAKKKQQKTWPSFRDVHTQGALPMGTLYSVSH